jgi:hypothetical protein
MTMKARPEVFGQTDIIKIFAFIKSVNPAPSTGIFRDDFRIAFNRRPRDVFKIFEDKA